MTIIEAILKALDDLVKPATYQQIYDKIEEKGYYKFGAKSPVSVVRVKLRLHSENVSIASGRGKAKYFRSLGGNGKDERFIKLNVPIHNDSVAKENIIKQPPKSIIIEPSKIQQIFSKFASIDLSLHKLTLTECFWMMFGAFLPIICDSLLRVLLLDIKIIEAFKQNLQGGEVFLLTSALITPFYFVLIRYINSDEEERKENKLPYFGWVFFLTIIAVLSGVFTFIYYRIGQLVRSNAESEVVKSMFSYEFGVWAIYIFLLSLLIWYYASYMSHRGVDSYKKIRKEQQQKLNQKFEATEEASQ